MPMTKTLLNFCTLRKKLRFNKFFIVAIAQFINKKV